MAHKATKRIASSPKLAPAQEKAILALMAEPSIARAAGTAGVAERTLHRWMDDARFMAAYRRARRESFSQAMAIAHRVASIAIGTLAKVMTDPMAPHAARVSAAAAVLKFGREAIELDDLAERIEGLEQQRARSVIDERKAED